MARQELKKLIPQRTASVQPVQAEDAPPSAEEADSIEVPQVAQEPPASTTPAKKPAPRRQAGPAASQPAMAPTAADDDDADSGRETATKGVPVHLPSSLNDRLQAYMARTRKSHQTVLLDALEATYDRLPDLIRQATAGESAGEEAPKASLFARPTLPAPVATGEPRVKHTVRVSPTNRKVLDTITAELEAPSRNFVIITAYEAFLPSTNES